MHILAGLGQRLRQERDRLRHNQEEFGSLVGVSRRTQAAYESDSTSPTVAYLSEAANAGVDVFFVLTGNREAGSLDATASVLLGYFEAMDGDQQSMVLQLCKMLRTSSDR